MGVPTQGTGPSTPWSDDASGYDPGPFDLPNDGSVWSFDTVMKLFARLINNIGYLYNHITERQRYVTVLAGTAGVVGATYSIGIADGVNTYAFRDPSANSVVTLLSTGGVASANVPELGQRLRVTTVIDDDPTHSISLKREDGSGPLCTLGAALSPAGAGLSWGEVEWSDISGTARWELVGWGGNVST